MRKALASALIGVLIILAVLIALFGAGCGTDPKGAAAGPAPTTAEGILAKAVASSQGLTSGNAQFNLSVAVEGDAGKMPAANAALLGKPITLSGTVAFNSSPPAVDASVNASIAGQELNMGLRAADKKAWVQFMGQWYELPADMMQGPGGTGTTLSKADAAAIMQALTAAGVDPATWLTGLKIVGNDTIDGTATYHLQGTVDFNKVMADVMKLMQDKTFMGIIGPLAGGMMGSTGSTMMGATSTSISLPSAQELQTLQSQLAAMFKNFTIDTWIAQDSYQVRQMQLDATIVPPAGQDAQGVNSVTLKFTISMAPATAPLTVTAPENVKPFSELQKALTGLEGLFSGMMGGAATPSSTGQ